MTIYILNSLSELLLNSFEAISIQQQTQFEEGGSISVQPLMIFKSCCLLSVKEYKLSFATRPALFPLRLNVSSKRRTFEDFNSGTLSLKLGERSTTEITSTGFGRISVIFFEVLYNP